MDFGSFEEKLKTLEKALCESINDKEGAIKHIFEILL